MRRYASLYLPMDEALILCAVDLSGRGGYYDALDIPAPEDRALRHRAGVRVHERLQPSTPASPSTCGGCAGRNSHHIVEGAFKALGRALREAAAIDPEGRDEIPSTKGML